MATKCFVVRGLAKEIEEDLNKFLSMHDVHILHMTQSSTGEYISVTLVYEEPSRVG
jgi:putative lipoic acid-binding regulatory protein